MIELKILEKLSQIHVLIVEDEELTAFAIKQSLVKHCRQVDIAKDGIEGFELFEQNRPDIIISDINLPKLNGLEMIHLIHEVSPHMPVIIMTSYDNSKNISESINEGAYNYLRKPICTEDLQITLLMATKDIYNEQVFLENSYEYKKLTKVLISPDNKIVILTKQERDLIHLLVSNIDKVVDYTIIESYVWQERSMSIDALRMVIRKIRKKTHNKIIENVSCCGYRINSLNK